MRNSGALERKYLDCKYYYEGISDLLAEKECKELADRLMELYTGLWDTPDVRCTFALTMYRYLFQNIAAGGIQSTDSIHSVKSFMVLIKGANSLFWLDLNTLQHRFQPLFTFLVERLTDEENDIGHTDIYSDLLKLVSRFICYYDICHPQNPVSKVGELQNLSNFIAALYASKWFGSCVEEERGINQVGSQDGLQIDPAAMVMIELVHQLHHVCIEDVLAKILCRMKSLNLSLSEKLDWHTRTKLQAALHSLSSPGGPLYPPRAIRIRARDVMDQLFPRGRHGRRLVNVSFRLLNPYRWPLSLGHW